MQLANIPQTSRQKFLLSSGEQHTWNRAPTHKRILSFYQMLFLPYRLSRLARIKNSTSCLLLLHHSAKTTQYTYSGFLHTAMCLEMRLPMLLRRMDQQKSKVIRPQDSKKKRRSSKLSNTVDGCRNTLATIYTTRTTSLHELSRLQFLDYVQAITE